MGRLTEEVRKHSRIALDTNIFIYLFEKHPIYGSEVKEVIELVEKGICVGITSTLLITEVLSKPLMEKDHDLYNRYMAFFLAFPNLLIKDVTREISIGAAKIRARYHLKTPDAIFISTAIAEGAEVFITNDNHLENVDDLHTLIIGKFLG